MLNAPLDSRWSFSKSSWSSFGRRGGAGPGDQLVWRREVVAKVRTCARRESVDDIILARCIVWEIVRFVLWLEERRERWDGMGI